MKDFISDEEMVSLERAGKTTVLEFISDTDASLFFGEKTPPLSIRDRQKQSAESRTPGQNFAVGFVKGVGQTAKGLGTLGYKLATAAGLPHLRGQEIYQRGTVEEQRARDLLTPASSAQKVGAVTEKIAESLIPSGALTRGAKLTSDALIKGSKVLSSIGRTLTQAGVEGAGQFGLGYIQSGGDIESAKVQGALSGGLRVGVNGIGAIVEKAGGKILNSIIKPTKVDIEDGFSIETIKKHNLGGSLTKMLEKTQAKMGQLSGQLNQKLASSKETIDLDKAYENTAKKLLGGKLSTFGSNEQMSSALQKLKTEIGHVVSEGSKPTRVLKTGVGTVDLRYPTKTQVVSIPDAQIIKRAAGNRGAWQFGLQDPESTALQKVYNTFYNEMKVAIEKGSPSGVKEINKQLQELIPIQNAIIRRIPVAERNNLVSLTDIISLTAGAIDPTALAGLGISVAQRSGTVGNVLTNIGPRFRSFPTGPTSAGATSIFQSPVPTQ